MWKLLTIFYGIVWKHIKFLNPSLHQYVFTHINNSLELSSEDTVYLGDQMAVYGAIIVKLQATGER